MLLRPTVLKFASPLTSPTPLRHSARVLSMPLRAKIMEPAKRTYADSAPPIDSLPNDPPADVTFASKYGVRTIVLNRPKKLNSLDGSMIRKIVPRLLEWQKSQMANVIIIRGEGRALCAGGDVAVLAQDCATGPEGQQRSTEYFSLEYRLDHLIATYPKPYVAFMDGITMGGGVGLSVHAPFRIATEKTVFAMPETTIGFFPDVGASFFLSRMDGGLGLYLALTSERLKGPEAYLAGVASHYLHSSSLPDLEARLAELQFKDYATEDERALIIDKTIEEFSTGLPHDLPHHLNSDIRLAIDYIFAKENDLDTIFGRLTETEQNTTLPQNVREWATQTRATINERSPTSVGVTWRLLQNGREWDIADAFQHEYKVAEKFMAHPDFVTGVTARLIEKTKGRPAWQPESLSGISTSDIDGFFEHGSPEGLDLLNKDPRARYKQYPLASLVGLPSEEVIRKELLASLEGSSGPVPQKTRESVLDAAHKAYGGRTGVKEKFAEVLYRMERDKALEEKAE